MSTPPISIKMFLLSVSIDNEVPCVQVDYLSPKHWTHLQLNFIGENRIDADDIRIKARPF